MLPLAYCVSLPCELKITSAISQSHKIESSMAFLTSPFFRFAKVACLLRSSLIRAILIFLRPISAPRLELMVSHLSSFLLANLSASFALDCPEEDVVKGSQLCRARKPCTHKLSGFFTPQKLIPTALPFAPTHCRKLSFPLPLESFHKWTSPECFEQEFCTDEITACRSVVGAVDQFPARPEHGHRMESRVEVDVEVEVKINMNRPGLLPAVC